MINRKTSLLLSLLVLLASGVAEAETYNVDVTHSEVGFRIRHIVSKVPGQFGEFSGTFEINRDDLEKSTAKFTIQAASIDTDNDRRDEHLRSEDFFWAEKYPEITFESVKVRHVGGDEYKVDGILNMRGVAKPITVDVTYLGIADMGERAKAGFDATATINRKDFGIEWNRALDFGGTLLGDEVTISINLELNREVKEQKE